ncbi:MAG: hypothetical protein ACAH83_20190 [Alphaproteobacteria bacterium]
MAYSKADEMYEKLKKMRSDKLTPRSSTPPGKPSSPSAFVAAVKAKINSLWHDLKYDWKYGSKDAEKPAGFLTRAFKKALIASTGASVLALGMSFLAGNSVERAYRSVFRTNPFVLTLSSDSPRSEDKIAPLFVGTSEVMRTIAMQEDLLTLGYPLSDCGANGEFRGQELTALNWFRASLGMPKSEFADGRTLRLLSEQAGMRRQLQGEFGGAARYQTVLRKSIVSPSLPEKMRIRSVQADLYQLGYKVGACRMNGVMTDQIVASVTQFQEKQDNIWANGDVDYKTQKALHDAARKSMADAGLLDNAKAQGLDDFSAIIHGQSMAADELEQLARRYVKGGAPEYVVQAVMEATQKAGFDFNYMMDLTARESGYKPWVGAGTSSAYGSFQFTDGTWLNVFKAYGPKYGYSELTKKISGGKINASAQEAKYIMDLRNDPKVAALMAIEFSKDNLARLQDTVGGTIGKTELYLAHFLGSGGATKFIQEFRRDNTQSAAALFPAEAAANQGIFYDSAGKPRSLGDIYANFARRMTGGQALRMVAAQGPKKLSADNNNGFGPKFG